MILDKKLQLASDMSIGAAGRDFTGVKTSLDKLNPATLRDFGRGEQVYACVTVKSDFTVAVDRYVGLSLCAEHLATTATIALAAAGLGAATGLLYHRLQPKVAFSGYIPGNLTSNQKNFVAGKRFIFPVNTFTHYSDYGASKYTCESDIYFLFEEFDSTAPGMTPTNSITNGTIDVDIVTLAQSGAGPGFNDQVCYPSTMKIS